MKTKNGILKQFAVVVVVIGVVVVIDLIF